MPNELVTFQNIYQAALRRAKGDGTDSDTLDLIKESIVTRYRIICSRKKWKFLRVTDRSVRLPIKYTTGTITVSNGSRTVTGIGTSWTSTHRNWWLKPSSSDNSYRVIAVGSATSLTIASVLTEDTITAGAYTLYPGGIALWPDLEDPDDVRIDGKSWKIKPKGPAEISRMRQQYPSREGAPEYYSVEAKESLFSGPLLQNLVLGYDFLGSGLTKSMIFFPHIPDDDYTIQIPYKRKVEALEADADEPLIPIEHRHVLLFYALADWYMKNRQDSTGRYYETLAKDELKQMANKYLDTDDVLDFDLPNISQISRAYLLRTSQNYFDREG